MGRSYYKFCFIVLCLTGCVNFPVWKVGGLVGNWTVMSSSGVDNLEISGSGFRYVNGELSNVVISESSVVIIEYPNSVDTYCVLYLEKVGSGYYRGWCKIVNIDTGMFYIDDDVIMVGGVE